MTQEVSKVQIEKKEYQELIEKWAHELKAPIASITLVCENNPSELSRKILLQANRLSYNVEQVLYYARLGYMSNDYMIKRNSWYSFFSICTLETSWVMDFKEDLRI